MSKLIATLVAGLISISAFAATPTTASPGATPTAVEKPAEAPAKVVKKAVAKATNKSTEKAVTPTTKTPADIK